MAGGNYDNTGDIRTYVDGGLFVKFPGVDKNRVIDAMSNLLIGEAINALWRTQKIFIMGGGACGDNQGIGSGPQAALSVVMVRRGTSTIGKKMMLPLLRATNGVGLTHHPGRISWVKASMLASLSRM